LETITTTEGFIMLYPLDFVQRACSLIYGAQVSDRTLRRWKSICHISPWSKQLSREQVEELMTLAYLRSKFPRKQLCYVHVKKQLLSSPIEDLLLQPYVKKTGDTLKGKDLPKIIYKVTKRRVTLRTLYRWSKDHSLEFGTKLEIPKFQLESWLELASR
jgi:hypothetical protein